MFSRAVMISFMSVFVLSSLLPEAHAVSRAKLWPKMCASCHDGKTAPDKEALRNKYPAVEDFTAAVLAKGDRCMNILKNDRKLIKRIADEIGIKNTAAK